jgi:GNAT-family acetyltransferase (TIGR03103 family)
VSRRSTTELPVGYSRCNRYTRVIIDEACARGIEVEVVDAERGALRLSLDGRTITTVESLSELTSAAAFRSCDDKIVTRSILEGAGLRIAPGQVASFDERDLEFLARHGDIVVKPAKGEQGWGITVGVTTATDLAAALDAARPVCPDVLLEARCPGDDLRVLVIDDDVVAASVRRPPTITGDGRSTVASLIRELSDRRSRATDGASTVALDAVTEAVVRESGYTFDSVLGTGQQLLVRRTANLHTGGTMHDVTDDLHPAVIEAARDAARALTIPVVGVDMIVPAVDGPDYTIIEANEQPGLANHEPRPTVERFVDLLFPATRAPRT